jgi:hypothetical protein
MSLNTYTVTVIHRMSTTANQNRVKID